MKSGLKMSQLIKLPNVKDHLKGIRETNCVSHYNFHDQNIVCSLILDVARLHFADKRSKIQKETIYEDFS